MRRAQREDLGVEAWGIVVVVVAAAVFALVVRRKWKAAVARREEVRRLVRVASAEAARAEIEHAFGCGFEKGLGLGHVGVSVGGGGGGGITDGAAVRLCAVCYSPTTTRCSRCKAVRYCSGKCQIIHWRQGHKDDCRPAQLPHIPAGAYPDLKIASAVKSKSSGVVTENVVVNLTQRGDHEASDRISSTSLLHKVNDAEVCNLVNKSTEKNIGSSPIPTSGCSPIPFVSECLPAASNSVECLPENKALTNSSSSGTSSNILKNSEELYKDAHTMSPLPDISTAAISVKRIPSLGKLNHQMAGCSHEELGCIPGMDSVMSKSGDSMNNSSSVYQEVTDDSMNHKSDDNNLSKLKSSEKSTKDSFCFSFDMPDDVVSSQRSSRSRLHPIGDYSSKTISCSKENDPYFVASMSVGAKNSNEPLPEHFQSKSQAKIDSTNEGNDASDRKPSNSVSYPTTETRNVALASNGGYALKSVRKVVQQLKPSKPSKSYKMLPPYDLYIKLYNEKVDMQPCGLVNCGNSCYANVVLQCLTFTRPLTAYFLQGLHSKTCTKKEWCFTCEFENLVVRAKEGKSPFSPIKILSHVHNLGSNLGRGKEEDAHEFLRYAIDAMQSPCLRDANHPSGQLFDETTLLRVIFGGYLRSKIRCMKCRSSSEQRERMMDLTVEIHGDGNIRTLEEALARFTATEILDGDNKYNCSRCKSYEKAKKKFSVLEAPNVLTIVLKRFQSGKFGKLNKTVQFPEILNMSKYMCSDSLDKTPIYCLYAVVVHVDIMNASFSGHYVCYVKNTQNKWYKIDDSTVKPVELDRVLSEGAYMLLYARISPRAPSSIIKEIPSHSMKSHQNFASGNNKGNALFRTRSSSDSGRDDATSDSSLFSCSDEGSCSTESTRDSTSTDDYTDSHYREAGGFNWYSPSRVSEDSDSFVTYSPLSARHLPEGSSVGLLSDFLSASNSASDLSTLDEEDGRSMGLSYASTSGVEKVGTWKQQDSRQVLTQGKETSPFLSSDTSKPCRKVTEQCSSREPNWDSPKSGLFMRKNTRYEPTR